MAFTAIAGTDTLTASRSVLNTGIQDAEKNRSGSSAPTSPVAGVFWRDTTGSPVVLKMWDGAAWRSLFPNCGVDGGGLAVLTGATFTGVVAGIAATTVSHFPIVSQLEALLQTSTVGIGTISANADRYVFRWPHAKTTLVAAYLLSDSGVAIDGANYWTFQLRNLTQAVNLCSVAKTTFTGGAAIVADAPYTLGVDQNNGPGTATPPAAGDVIELQITETGTASNLGNGGGFACALTYKVGIV